MELQGKVALVTGAAKRVGKEIALHLAARGCSIAVHYNRSREEAQRLVEELKITHKVRAKAFRAELSKTKDVQKLAADAVKAFGQIDVLVNCASLYERTPFGTVTEKDWDSHLDINVKAPFFLSQALGAQMRRQGAGKIVNIADWSGLRPYAGYMPYCISKGGVITLTYALAKALGPQVQVNAVLPGPVLLPPDVTAAETKAIVQATLTKRLGSPKDVAKAVLFLIEGSDFITGATLTVDGEAYKLTMYTVTRVIHFCYGHRLMDYQGKCRVPHGHNGVLEVTIASETLDKLGMVVDFEEIKQKVQKWVDAELDHKMLFNETDPLVRIFTDLGEPFVKMKGNPTAEAISKLVFDYARSQKLPVTEVRLWETVNSFATYAG